MKTQIITIMAGLVLTACSTFDQALPKGITGSGPVSAQAITVEADSDFEFDETERRLRQAIESRGLRIFTVVDHGAGARNVNRNIGANKLYIFGNPNSGTPLMAANPQMGLALPMKMLIYGTGNDITVAYPDIYGITDAYKIRGDEELIDNIADTLDDILYEATEE